MWTFKDNKFLSYVPFFPDLGLLKTMEPGNGYYIKMKETAILDITGIKNLCGIELNKGWNLTGFNLTSEKEISEALSSITDKYRSIWIYNDKWCHRYSPKDPGSAKFSKMKPGQGYWIFATEDCVWEVK